MVRVQPGQLRPVAGTLLPQVADADPAPGADQRGDRSDSGDPGGLHHVAPDLAVRATDLPGGGVAAVAGQPAAAKLRLAGDSRPRRHAQPDADGPGPDQAPDHAVVQPERRVDGPGANRLPAGRVADCQRHARCRPQLRRSCRHPGRQSLPGVPPGGIADESAGDHYRCDPGVRLQRQQFRGALAARWPARADAGGDGA
ncbi:hypothetical protein D3C72_1772100 [compost metagenome]